MVEVFGCVEPHAAGALYDRLEDHRSHLLVVRGEQPFHGGEIFGMQGFAGPGLRPVCEQMLWKHLAETFVHARYRVADAHRAEGVAVVAAADGRQPVFFGSSDGAPVLDRHLDGDLHGDRARIAEEDVLQTPWRKFDEGVREVDGGLVRQASEHDVGNAFELRAHGGVQFGVVVAVDRTPPGRHAVDQFATVGQANADTLRGNHRVDG